MSMLDRHRMDPQRLETQRRVVYSSVWMRTLRTYLMMWPRASRADVPPCSGNFLSLYQIAVRARP